MKASDKFSSASGSKSGPGAKLAASSYDQTVRQQRNLVAAAIFILLASLVGIGLFIYRMFIQGITAWQLTFGAIGAGILLLGALLAFWFARRQEIIIGVWVFILAVWAGILLIGGFLANVGQTLGLTTIVFTIGLAALTLPQRSVGRVIILGVVLRFALELLAQYLGSMQYALVEIESFANIAAAVTLVALGLLIAWQFGTLSLTNKLVLIFLTLTLVGANIISSSTTSSTGGALRDNIGNNLKAQADAQARLVGDLLTQQVASLRALATNDVLREAVIQANAAYPADQYQIDAQLAALDLEWVDYSSRGDLTSTLINNRLNNDSAAVLHEFQHLLTDNVEVFLTDLYGGVVAATNVTSDYAQADEEWWQGAYNLGWGSIYLSNPEYDESARATSILMAVPVVNPETGKLIGVLRTTYLIDPIIRSLAFVKLGETGELDLYFPGATPLHIHEGQMEPVEPEQFEQLTLAGEQVFTEMEYEGNISLVSLSPVISSIQDLFVNELGWYVVAHQHVDEALAAVNQQVRDTRLLVAVIAVIVSLGAIWLARTITGPIVRLTEVAARVREGDLSVFARSETSDEVGTLAETFNQMTGQIRQIMGGLEQRISERTRELTLAAEIGRSLSQVRDLDMLLNQAVELIQFSFDLYYTQVYLVDSTGRVLILRAGTGDVGEELLRRHHRLAVGPGSINGLAASDRRPILVTDTEVSPIFRSNPLLPETRSELSVPLLVGDQVVGVLDMQSSKAGALSEENLAAFQTLAGQLAIAIDNARLIEQQEGARKESEQQARRLSIEGWRQYLDALHRSERIGYAYDGETIQRILPSQHVATSSHEILALPVGVLGQSLGEISLERDAKQVWSQSDRELVEAIAGQIGRQIENLRLLSQAEQYRVEAEDAARRLTREGWQSYLQGVGEAEVSFMYDGEQVTAAEASIKAEETGHVQPLQVRDVFIGELIMDGDTLSAEDRNMVEFVAERLVEHIENLRLAAQTGAALASSEALYAGSEAIVRSRTIDSVLDALAAGSALNQFEHSSIYLFDEAWGDQMPETAELVGDWRRSGVEMADDQFFQGMQLTKDRFRYVSMLQGGKPFFIDDVQSVALIDARRMEILTGLGRSIVVIPLVAADQWIGWLLATSSTPVHMNEEQIRQIQSLIGQASTVIQGIRLLQQTEASARREKTLRRVVESLRSTVNPEQVLRLAVKEVGEILGRNVLIRLVDSPKVAGTVHQDDL